MELTKEQLLQIDNYVYVSGVKYYDVRTEIVDHFANILEQKLNENPDLDFKKEIENIHRNFSNRGFSKLLEEKTKSVQNHFYKNSLKHLITFFKFPKIIVSGALFYVLFLLMNSFESKEDFFSILTGFGFLFLLGMYANTYLQKKRKRDLFLSLNMNNSFIQTVNLIVLLLHNITNFRTEKNYTNLVYNNIQLLIFVIVFLLFWSALSVFYQNKKEVQQQYPNIIV